MPKRIRKKQGDIFRVPLNNGKYRYLQFIRVADNFLSNDLVRAFSYCIDNLEQEQNNGFLNKVVQSNLMFYQYAWSINVGMKMFEWERVGNIELEENFKEPQFLNTSDDDENGIFNWYLLEYGKETTDLGRELPVKYHDLPFQSGTNPKIMAEIMELGYDKYNFTKHYLKK